MRRAGLIAGILGTLIVGTPVPGLAARADGSVVYRGLRIPVPAGWEVHRLGPRSTDCLRFDRHAIYLGPAGAGQLCPAHAVGRTEAIHVEPLTDQTRSLVSGMLTEGPDRPDAGRMTPDGMGELTGLTVRDPATHEIRVAMPDAGVLITGSYGTGPGDLERILARIDPEPDPETGPEPAPEPVADDAGAVRDGMKPVPDGIEPVPADAERRSGFGRRHRWVTGDGFDTCTAPPLEAMEAWRDDFVAANIYIGGAARACPDGLLSRDWVRVVRRMGWRLIPTYVGPQAPCGPRRKRKIAHFTPRSAVDDGVDAAEDAVDRARALGLRRHTPIYYDLEAYDHHNEKCRDAVLDFVDAWSRRLHSLGYVPGFYSSVASGIRDVGEATGIRKPTAVWFAHWDKNPDTKEDDYLDDGWWPGHRRIKQYRGQHRETHGGWRLNIDSDAVDGLVR